MDATFLPRRPEKEVFSLRLPIDLVADIDDAAAIVGISRNEWITQALQFALARQADLEGCGHD